MYINSEVILNTYCMPSIVLGLEGIIMSKTQLLSLGSLHFVQGDK